MPVSRPFRKFRKSRKPFRRLRRMAPSRRLIVLNPKPVFTETFKISDIAPNSGGIMTFNMDDVPQLSQYNNLYTKYRILKAVATLLPNYDGQDQNSAQYNIGVANAYASGMSRIVFAVQDSAASLAPTSEADVLKDNGCKIRPFSNKQIVKMSCRPVPLATSAGAIVVEQKRKFLTFDPAGGTGNAKHYGITYWHTQPVLGQTPTAVNSLAVYVKLTFQLADPR